jgi:hypothetical protein
MSKNEMWIWLNNYSQKKPIIMKHHYICEDGYYDFYNIPTKWFQMDGILDNNFFESIFVDEELKINYPLQFAKIQYFAKTHHIPLQIKPSIWFWQFNTFFNKYGEVEGYFYNENGWTDYQFDTNF